jgi:hypothetical protein
MEEIKRQAESESPCSDAMPRLLSQYIDPLQIISQEFAEDPKLNTL